MATYWSIWKILPGEKRKSYTGPMNLSAARAGVKYLKEQYRQNDMQIETGYTRTDRIQSEVKKIVL